MLVLEIVWASEHEYHCIGRVEEDRRGRRRSPLVKPDVQISRIRLTKGISAKWIAPIVDAGMNRAGNSDAQRQASGLGSGGLAITQAGSAYPRNSYTPYAGPSLEILNRHREADNLNFVVRPVDSKQLDELFRNNLISPYAYKEAHDLLPAFGKVNVAISPQLSRGINAHEQGARIGGMVRTAGGVAELAASPFTGPGVFVVAPHAIDNIQAGVRSMWTGISQDTMVSKGAQYVGVHALGFSPDGAESLGRLTEFGLDFAIPSSTIGRFGDVPWSTTPRSAPNSAAKPQLNILNPSFHA